MIFDILPRSLVIALGVQVSCQLIKFLTYSVKQGRPSWKHLATFGGMPSAHSAFVTSLAASVGVLAGFNSELFALAAVFGGIVIFDAYKLRGNVQKQAIVVNRLQATHLKEDDRIPINEMVGHSAGEIVAGIAWALVVAVPAALWLK
jgi:hypothetical protein